MALGLDTILSRAKDGTLPVETREQIRESIGVLAETTRDALKREKTAAERLEVIEKAADGLKEDVEDAKKKMAEQAQENEKLRAAIAVTPGATEDADVRALRSLPPIFVAPKDMRNAGISDRMYTLMSASENELRAIVPNDQAIGAVMAWQRLRALLVTMDAIRTAHGRDNSAAGEQYRRAGGWRSLPGADAYLGLSERFAAAFDMSKADFDAQVRSAATSNVGEGLEWIPTGWGTNAISVVGPELSLESYFSVMPMPTQTFKNPLTGYTFKSRRVPESTTLGQNLIPQSALVTGDMVWTADTHSAFVGFSMQMDLGSLLNMAQEAITRLSFALVWGRNSAHLNGQKTSTFDTDAVIDADDTRKMYDGLRWAANAIGAGTMVDGGTGLIADLITLVKGKMGRWGRNPGGLVHITGFMGYALLLNMRASDGSPVVLTQDRVGPSAAIRSGVFGLCFGSPIHVDDDYPENQDDTGKAVAAGTKTGILTVHRDYFRPGRYMSTQIMASEHVHFLANQVVVKANAMDAAAFVEAPGPDKKFVGRIVNLALPAGA